MNLFYGRVRQSKMDIHGAPCDTNSADTNKPIIKKKAKHTYTTKDVNEIKEAKRTKKN